MFTKVKLVSAVWMVLALYGGCAPKWFEAGDFGGQDSITVHMPFAYGVESQCVQGVNGSFSHQYSSTEYDVDFDTPNNADLDVMAPISGTAYVHEDADSGFGIHVNIDLGDGTYIILAHLKRADVPDGTWVEMGETIGVEGATGFATGDHVHMGRHRGDASRDGIKGTSVEGLSIRAEDVWYGTTITTSVSSLNCGLVDGRVYASLLPNREGDSEYWAGGDDGQMDQDTAPDDGLVADDGEILICLNNQFIAPTVTGVKLYAIGEAGAASGEPFYEEGSEVIDILEIAEDAALSPETCEIFHAEDDETVWVNGFAYVGRDPSEAIYPEFWRHFVTPVGSIYGEVTAYSDTAKQGPARNCTVQSFLYYDVNADGPTDFNSVQKAYHCPPQ